MKMTNRRNQLIYRTWAPIYDSTVNHLFKAGRERAMELLDLKPGEKVLLVGVGTGADLPLLPPGVGAIGIDLSADMLRKASLKLARCAATVRLIQGDAQALLVEEASFDAAILNLILSVVPDAPACLQSTLQALKPGARIAVFDKFQPDHERLALMRRVINIVSTLLGTDITRCFRKISQGCPCSVTHEEPSILSGMYRVMLLKRV
jgi:phosphatidylethanolamine/phosphatidyl-N-methylethanolamine N-methyltransferase